MTTILSSSFNGTITVVQLAPAVDIPGLLLKDGSDLVLQTPTATGTPLPVITLTVLTRGGVNVLSELVGNTIPNAADGTYVVEWTAINGVAPNLTISDSLVFADTAPTITANGALSLINSDLIITAPTATGNPVPTVTLTTLTRGGSNVLGEVTANTIPNATVGVYVALWTASNGVSPAATYTTTLEIVTPTEGTTSLDGDYIEIALPSGFSESNSTIVDPSGVTVTQTVPSLNSSGVANTRSVTRKSAYSATIVGTKLRLGMAEYISSHASAVSLTINAGAMTNGVASNSLITGDIIPNNLYGDGLVKLRLAGLVTGRTGLHMAWSVMSGPFRVEAIGGQDSGLAGVLFSVSRGGTTVEHFVENMDRSRYQSLATISNAQWTANCTESGDAVRGGSGVWASPEFNPDDFTDGVATVTATGYAYVGGTFVNTSDTWSICLNGAGTYVDRIRYVDTVSGNDTTGTGLTAGTAYATINKAANVVGSQAGGATAFSVPIIKVVGSGNPAAPRTIALVTSTASGTSLPKITDTYVTIQPAEGHDANDTWLSSNKRDPRIRRLRLKDIGFDIAQGTGSQSSAALLTTNTSVYPPTADPVSVWFDGVVSFHSLGAAGQTSEGDSGYVLTSNFGGNARAYFTRYTVRDMSRKAHSCPPLYYIRDFKFITTVGDVLKGPNGLLMEGYIEGNSESQTILTLSSGSVTGAIAVGDTVTGVKSSETATVNQIVSTARAVLAAPGARFKADDNVRHGAVTVTNGSGFTVGELVNGKTLHRKDGNILRFGNANAGASAFLPTAGTVLVGATSSASSTVVSSVQENNLFFSPSGARATVTPPHPDITQVQTFLPHRIVYTITSGAFQLGESVRMNSITKGTVQDMGTTIDGRTYMTVGGLAQTWFDTNEGLTITGLTSGATGVFNGVYDFPNGNYNTVMYNIWSNPGDGCAFFAENGWRGLLVANYMFVSNNGERANPTQMARVQDHDYMHMSAHQRPFINGTDAQIAPRARMSFVGIIAEYTNTPSTPGAIIVGIHSANPSSTLSTGDTTKGDPLFVDGVGFDDDHDLSSNNYTPGSGSPLKRLAARRAGAWMPFDLFGNRRPTNGTAAIGAIEAATL